MERRERMKINATDIALRLGHKLRAEWTKNRWGFHTTCSNCGALAGITVSREFYRGSAIDGSYQCPGPRAERKGGE